MVVTGDTAGCVESVWNSTIRHTSATTPPPIKVIFHNVYCCLASLGECPMMSDLPGTVNDLP
jgi:hypothetical protein